MGLLDDAIREHLELKRRRGGDPGEIEREEREALGPVRRMPEPGDAGGFEGPYDADDAEILDEELDVGYGEETGHVASEFEPAPPSHRVGGSDTDAEFFDRRSREPADLIGDDTVEYRVAPEDHEHADFDLHELGPDDPRHDAPPFDAPPFDGPRPGAVPLRPHRDEAPEPPSHTHPHPHAHEADEDVLEETPEFLQDTPDHDRLWFEQRPPRDFKFDD